MIRLCVRLIWKTRRDRKRFEAQRKISNGMECIYMATLPPLINLLGSVSLLSGGEFPFPIRIIFIARNFEPRETESERTHSQVCSFMHDRLLEIVRRVAFISQCGARNATWQSKYNDAAARYGITWPSSTTGNSQYGRNQLEAERNIRVSLRKNRDRFFQDFSISHVFFLINWHMWSARGTSRIH